jgi:hypothetical protein
MSVVGRVAPIPEQYVKTHAVKMECGACGELGAVLITQHDLLLLQRGIKIKVKCHKCKQRLEVELSQIHVVR